MNTFAGQVEVVAGCRKGEVEQASTSGNGVLADGDDVDGDVAKWTAYLAPAAVVLGLGLLVGGGFVFKHQLKDFIDYFVEVVDTWGALRWACLQTCLHICRARLSGCL